MIDARSPKPPPADDAALAGLPFEAAAHRIDGKGFRWFIEDGSDLPRLMICAGQAMQGIMTPQQIADFGPRVLMTFDMRSGKGIFSVENLPERSEQS